MKMKITYLTKKELYLLENIILRERVGLKRKRKYSESPLNTILVERDEEVLHNLYNRLYQK